MTEPNPEFDAVHPSAQILFRSTRGGYMHSVVLGDAAMRTDAATLAEGILLTAEVSYLRALMEVRAEIVAAGHTPSGDLPTQDDLRVALGALAAHDLYHQG